MASALCPGQDLASFLQILAVCRLLLVFSICLCPGLIALSEFAGTHITPLSTFRGKATGHERLLATASRNQNLPDPESPGLSQLSSAADTKEQEPETAQRLPLTKLLLGARNGTGRRSGRTSRAF